MKIAHNKSLIFFLLISINMVSCKKFIEVDPPATSVNGGNVFENDGTAISAVVGIYTTISRDNFASYTSYLPELYADNLKMLNLTFTENTSYYQNNLVGSSNAGVVKPWLMLYPPIFQCNSAIEGLSKSTSTTPTVRQNLLGQVYFLRALFYFYLTNFYGEVPLALSSDYSRNNNLKRSSTTEIYTQIIADLKQAQALLPEGYLTGNMTTTFPSGQEQRVTANRYAASALLARVYLYQKDWINAETTSAEVIGKSNLYSISLPLTQVFQKNSKETIWALQPVSTGANTYEGDMYILRTGDPTPNSVRSTFFTQSFIDNFQKGDQRKVAWIDTIRTDNVTYRYPAKYRAIANTAFTEQSIFFRLAELYLIRAEARIQLGKVSDGIADLNAVRERAIDRTNPDESQQLKLWSISLSKEDAITALNYERRSELFTECAHRWFDLKRTGQVDAVMGPATAQKGGIWSSYKTLYPIPSEELLLNTNLRQNDGYTN